jgi:hypothetical protein
MIKWLIALLAGIAAVGAAVFFWSRNRKEASELWHQGVDATTSWSKSAAEKASEATDKVAEAANNAAAAASDAVQQ